MIVKVCKKHGELTEENTYFQKTKSGNKIRMCSICKKGYRCDWAKLNPEKVKVSQIKMRENRLKELENGTLKKTCKKHGELPIDRIRIDARGTKICRYCSNEQSYSSHDNPKYKARQKEWYHSDIDRKRRYAKNDNPKRKIRQKRYYHELKIKDPEKHKEQELKKKKWAREGCKKLNDGYVNGLLRTIRTGGKKNIKYEFLSGVTIPKEITELKKVQILLNRELRKQRKLKNGN